MALSPFLRPFGITAAILGLIQGVVWSILAIIAILIHSGAWKPQPSTSTYGGLLSDTIVKGYLNGSILGNLYLGPRTFFIWAVLYLITSLFWVVLSSYQLWAIVQEKFKLFKKAYLGWSTWTVIMCFCDLILASLLASDYNTLVQVTNLKGNTATKEDFFGVLSCGVMMTLIARGFVLWIVNVTFAIIVMKLSIDLPRKVSENQVSSNTINAFENTNLPRDWEPDRPNLDRSNSFMSSKSFGTFQGLPRLPPVQSTNEPLARLARTNDTKSFNATRPRTNNSYLYRSAPGVSSPTSSAPRSPLDPPLKSVLKNRTQPPYT